MGNEQETRLLGLHIYINMCQYFGACCHCTDGREKTAGLFERNSALCRIGVIITVEGF